MVVTAVAATLSTIEKVSCCTATFLHSLLSTYVSTSVSFLADMTKNCNSGILKQHISRLFRSWLYQSHNGHFPISPNTSSTVDATTILSKVSILLNSSYAVPVKVRTSCLKRNLYHH